MNRRAVGLQAVIFTVQWSLMLIGFWMLSQYIQPARMFANGSGWGGYLDAALKALVALTMSLVWLFLWDRQVRWLFYRANR